MDYSIQLWWCDHNWNCKIVMRCVGEKWVDVLYFDTLFVSLFVSLFHPLHFVRASCSSLHPFLAKTICRKNETNIIAKHSLPDQFIQRLTDTALRYAHAHISDVYYRCFFGLLCKDKIYTSLFLWIICCIENFFLNSHTWN